MSRLYYYQIKQQVRNIQVSEPLRWLLLTCLQLALKDVVLNNLQFKVRFSSTPIYYHANRQYITRIPARQRVLEQRAHIC